MNIADAIAHLKRLERQHGADVEVFFDCPGCAQAFTPSFVTAEKAVVVHALTPKKEGK